MEDFRFLLIFLHSRIYLCAVDSFLKWFQNCTQYVYVYSFLIALSIEQVAKNRAD